MPLVVSQAEQSALESISQQKLLTNDFKNIRWYLNCQTMFDTSRSGQSPVETFTGVKEKKNEKNGKYLIGRNPQNDLATYSRVRRPRCWLGIWGLADLVHGSSGQGGHLRGHEVKPISVSCGDVRASSSSTLS